MRRFRLFAGILALWLAVMPVGTVLAQQISPPLTGIVGPAGAIWYSTASQTVSNTTAATYLVSYTIPGSMFATSASSNFPSSLLGPSNSSVPLHLRIEGVLDTLSSPGTINLGVNFGTSQASTASGPATMTLLNAVTPGGLQVAQPVILDVWLNPIATGSQTNPGTGAASPNIVNTVYMRSQAALILIAGPTAQGTAGAAAATMAILNVATIANVNVASAAILNVIWQFGTAGNYLRIFKVYLRQVD